MTSLRNISVEIEGDPKKESHYRNTSINQEIRFFVKLVPNRQQAYNIIIWY